MKAVQPFLALILKIDTTTKETGITNFVQYIERTLLVIENDAILSEIWITYEDV